MAGANLIVFRDVDQQVAGRTLCKRLIDAVEKADLRDSSSLIEALLIAGQAEGALEDSNSPQAYRLAAVTDNLATCFLGGSFDRNGALSVLRGAMDNFPEHLKISTPEGFAYYALHPGDFADFLTPELGAKSAAVIGIRSIGTVLSAVAAAAMRNRGIDARRITVRPVGHPYDRRTELCELRRLWVDDENRRGSHFFVVDEGPGLSGSSFLSVGESLLERGITRERITFVGTRQPDPAQLCARDAARRWSGFRFTKATSRICNRFRDYTSLAGGTWRSIFLNREAAEPACWPEMETLKFLSPGRNHIFKFEGFGERGRQVRERAALLNTSGFGPEVVNANNGMTEYAVVQGEIQTASSISTELLDRIAAYCAFRAGELAVGCNSRNQLEEMTRFNFRQETGRDLEIPVGSLGTSHAVLCDSRMQPHKWVTSEHGIFKVDGCAHGDDHFCPGPTDIAWDLAGAIIEWDMDCAAEDYLLARFRDRTGRPTSNVAYFLLAYSTFRMAYCKMAMLGTQDEGEKPRLQRACEYYQARISAATGKLLAST
jgi:hypothetical protein